MRRTHAPTLIGIVGVTVGVTVLLGFSVGKVEPATPTVKVPGAYPYEETVQVPAATPVAESSSLPSPAPFPYPDSRPPASIRDSQTANGRRPLTAKAVREAAFKYNGVAKFFGFLAALPADVSVFDPQLGRTRALVKGGRVMPKNAAWLHKRKQTTAHEQGGTSPK
jgi:hypothetical protein